MSQLATHFKSLNYLASHLADSDSFDIDAQHFARLVRQLRDDIYDATSSPAILDRLDQIPDLNLDPHERSLLESLLPSGARSMVGNYQNKQKILAQVQEITRAFNRLRDLLPLPPSDEELV
ncbi:MAG: hypothetical protein HUU34_10475 [Saprospiraceae bacterium]|jgi:hypothetical protein|nr:hypothetical protein [Saprospiraceae bacterium]